MKLIYGLLLIFSFHILALSDSQETTAYRACLRFSRMSPAQQRAVAAKSGYSLGTTQWGCNLMVKQGLRKDIELEHEFQSGRRRGGGGGGRGHSPECTSNQQCTNHNQCVGGSCEPIGGPRGDCRNNGGCAPGYNCRSTGICD